MPIPETMKALVTTGDSRFTLQDVAVPFPGAGQLLVQVAAVAQNHVDWKYLIVESKVKGAIMGWDFAGTVAQLGPNCPNRKQGERVAAFIPVAVGSGAFAEYVTIRADMVIPLPDGVSFEDAAGLGTACISACQCLYQELNLPLPSCDSTPIKSCDQWVLVWSGASSVGQYAIQLAKLSGLKVVCTAAPANHEFVKSLGADAVFDHSDSWTARQIFALTGGTLAKAVDCWSQGMSPNQICMSLGQQGGQIATLLPYEGETPGIKTSCVAANTIYGEDTSFPFVTVGSPDHMQNGRLYCKLISTLIAQNKLRLVPVKVYPAGLLGVAEGIEYMRLGKVHAEKIVYRIADTSPSKIARYM